MATKVSIADGNWSTAATWGSLSNTPTLHASSNRTVSTGTYYTVAFTAPNTTNNCLGAVLLWVTSGVSTTGSITVTLQENPSSWADVAGASKTINFTEATSKTRSTWLFFEFTTPYTYTSTTAGYYRFKIAGSATGWSTSCSFAYDSGAANIAYLAVDNRTGAPGTTDDVFICGHTVTVDGSQTIGSGTTVNAVPTQRTLGNSFIVGHSGVLTWDTSANSSLTVKGNYFVCSNSSLTMGTEASPFPDAYTAKLICDEGTTSSSTGGRIGVYDVYVSLWGRDLSFWRTTKDSGAGTAADPLITDDSVDWSVGDELVFVPNSNNATNYNETEIRFIITKNSATSYVLSATAGGAEAALVYTHEEILNTTRNVVIETTNTSYGTFLDNTSQTALSATTGVHFEWMRFNTSHNQNTPFSNYGFAIAWGVGTLVECDYSVSYNRRGYGFGVLSTKEPLEYNGLISYKSISTSNSGLYLNAAYNQTLNDCYCVGEYGGGTQASLFDTYNRCKFIACNTNNASDRGGFYTGGLGTVLNDCEFHCNRYAAVNSNSVDMATFNNCLFGTKGYNTVEVNVQTDFPSSAVFDNCLFSSTLMQNYLLGGAGLLYQFNKYNQTANKHFWYTNYGYAQSTGSSLDDTTVRTAGSLGLRITPQEATTGFSWEFKIFQKANSIVNFYGYFQKNATFATDVARVELWLDGSTTADATFTLADDATWQACSLSAIYTGSVDTLATIKVKALSATSGAYLYCDDFYNAGDTVSSSDKVTGLDTWYQGMPVDIIAPQAVSPADIWTFSTTQLTTPNTTGKKLKDGLTTNKFIGLQ